MFETLFIIGWGLCGLIGVYVCIVTSDRVENGMIKLSGLDLFLMSALAMGGPVTLAIAISMTFKGLKVRVPFTKRVKENIKDPTYPNRR